MPTNSIILNYAPISLSANAGCIVFNTNRAAATSGASLPDSEDTVFLVDTTPTATPEHIVVTSDEALGSTAATNPSSRNARRAVSADCSRVVFKTNRNLDAASPVGDSVYLRDRNAGTTSRVSFTDGYPTRLYAISISTDGSTVTFDDSKEGRTDGPPFTNPGEAWAFDVAAGTRRWITDVDGSSYFGPKVFLNQDGSRAALYTQQIRRLVSGSYSTTCNGGCVSLLNTVTREARTALDTMGLAYDNTPDSMLASHDMTRLVVRQGRSLYWFDVGTGERRLVNPGRGTSQPPTSGSLENYQFDINADGRYVVFAYSGTTLVGPDGVGDHLYRWDANTSTLELLTVNADGSLPSAVIGVTPVTPTIEQVSVDATGQVVAFVSGESVGFGNGLAAGTNDGRETGLWLWDNR